MSKRLFFARHALRWLLPIALAIGVAGTVQAQPGGAPELHSATALSSASSGPATATAAVSSPAAAITVPGTDAQANPYGLHAVWEQGDLIARATLVVLAAMSLLSWYFIIAKLLEQRQWSAQAWAAKKAFDSTDSLQQRATALEPTSPFRLIVDSALDAKRRHDSLAGQVDMNSWLSQDIVQSVATLQIRSQTGLSVLATVGSTAPFVGLFGTVWGIYNALVTIGVSGQASIEKVAGPVGEALIMTALGLAVAVPAVLGYNWLVRRNRVTLHAIKGFGSELHTLLLVEIDKGRRAAGAKTRT